MLYYSEAALHFLIQQKQLLQTAQTPSLGKTPHLRGSHLSTEISFALFG